MIFKPRIFISSTLNENLKIRSKIEDFFSSIGAETLLYEKNLTPSVNAMTYRRDILDADFIIFIIKNEYGTRTDYGISGTHEELIISLENKIPKHVYIKLEDGETNAKELIDEINNNQISYYYFKNDTDLLKRIKATTFTIAKEIMLKKLEDSQLSKYSIKRISTKYDYERAVEIIKIIESMKKVENNFRFDWVDTNIFDAFISPIVDSKERERWIFIDKKIEDILDELLVIYHKFNCHCIDYTTIPGTNRSFEVDILGQVTINSCSVCRKPELSRDGYMSIIKEFFEQYSKLRKYIEKMRLDTDTII